MQHLVGNRQLQQMLRPDRRAETEAAVGVSPENEAVIERKRGTGEALDSTVKVAAGQSFGADLSTVRVHRDKESDQLNRDLHAAAFTSGQDIFFRSDTLNPHSETGAALLAHELTHVVSGGSTASQVHRACACGGKADEQCEDCRKTAGPAVSPLHVQRYSWDDFADDVSGVASAAVSGASQAASTVADTATSAASAVADTATEAASAVANTASNVAGTVADTASQAWHAGTQAVSHAASTVSSAASGAWNAATNAAGEAWDSATSAASSAWNTVSSTASSAWNTVSNTASQAWNTVQGVAGAAWDAAGEAADWALTAAGQLALDGANRIAGLFGGSVRVTPDGLIIDLPEIPLFPVSTIPLIPPTPDEFIPLLGAGAELGPLIIAGALGIRMGNPSVNATLGPGKVQNITIRIDPSSSTYSAAGELYAPAALTVTEVISPALRGEALLVIPSEPPIPIDVAIEGGARFTFRGSALGALSEAVQLQYSGGDISLDLNTGLQLGALFEIDLDAYVRGELYHINVCEYVWPLDHWQEGDAVQLNLPVTISSRGEEKVHVGELTAMQIPVESIRASIDRRRPQTRCLSMDEIKRELCKIGKLPDFLCSGQSGNGGGGAPVGPAPLGPGPVGPTPIGPGPVGPTPVGPTASAPTGRTPNNADRIPMRWYKTDEHYDTPITLDGERYSRKSRKNLKHPDADTEIGVSNQFLPRMNKPLTLAFYPDLGNKERFRTLLSRHGYTWDGVDADHNQDLQWAGEDDFTNLWPMDFRTNRSAGNLQNNLQQIVFADRPGDPPNPPMSLLDFKAAGLHHTHPYFKIAQIEF